MISNTAILSILSQSNGSDNGQIFTAILSLLATISLQFVSFVDHRRSITSCDAIVSYLVCTLLRDLVIVSLPSGSPMISEDQGRLPFAGRACLECALLFLEVQSKKEDLQPQYQELPPEELSSITDQVLFWWLNPVLREGYHEVLTESDLPLIHRNLLSKVLRKRILKEWRSKGMICDSPWWSRIFYD